MIVVNLDDNIVFGTLPSPPELRLLVFVSDKNVGDVNRLKDGKIMISKVGKYFITSAERSRVSGAFLSRFFLAFLFLRLRIS